MKHILSISLILATCAIQATPQFEEYEKWWENSLENTISLKTFHEWLGNVNSPSRQKFRDQITSRGYKSVLDAACGLCIDYVGLKRNNIEIDYQGLDVTPKLVELAKKNHIPIQLGSIESMPFEDDSFDLVYARHILEHLPNFEKALSEAIRVATKEVMVVFFIPPTTEPDRINPGYFTGIKLDENGFKLYHNRYNINDLEGFAKRYPKVDFMEWDSADTNTILHIYLK